MAKDMVCGCVAWKEKVNVCVRVVDAASRPEYSQGLRMQKMQLQDLKLALLFVGRLERVRSWSSLHNAPEAPSFSSMLNLRAS